MQNKIYWDNYKPDSILEVNIDGYKVVTYSFGESEEVILCLNGGPGASCDYVRDSHSFLVELGFRVVAFDQLGTGNSDRPDDISLWTIERYREEVEQVRKQLNLGKVHLLGQSWGGWLAIEYCSKYLDNIKTLVLENTCADIPHLKLQLVKLRQELGSETLEMMEKCEAEADFNNPKYREVIKLLDSRHALRMKDKPAPVLRTAETFNCIPYEVMQGPNEYHYIGNLKEWSRISDLERFNIPTLITVGEYDLIPSACSELMLEKLPNAQLEYFNNCSHQPFYEDPEKFQRILKDFYLKHNN